MAKITVNNPKNVVNSKIGKNYFKLVGTGGPKGDKGDKGDTGAAATISAGTASSLPAGSSPTVTNSGTSSAAVFNFGIPKGDKGDKGDTGATGAAATITVGSTTTGAAGTNATVTNTGTSGAAVLNFTIPRGDKGETGATGATGATGQAATIAVGSTTTLTPGSSATVTNSGTSSAATFNFGIPQGVKGDTGSVKSAYVTSLPSTGNENTYYLNGDTATTGSVSGTAVQITNADNTGEISDFKLNGNTEQTTYTGKNRLVPRYSSDQTISSNGITCVYNASEQTMTFNGTCSLDNTVFYFSNTDMSFTANTTKASVYYLGGTVETYCAARFYGSDYNGVSFYIVDLSSSNPIISQTASTSFTMIANNSSIRFNNGSKATNFKIKIMVADTANTDYEPYTGNLPSPNPDYPQAVETVTGAQNIMVSGKNFAKLTSTSGYFYVSGLPDDPTNKITQDSISDNSLTFSISESGNYVELISNDIQLKPNSQYTLSFNRQTTLSNNQTFIYGYSNGQYSLIYRDNNGGVLQTTFTSPSNGVIRLGFGSGLSAGTATISDIQLELGASKTTFTPYQRLENYEINLGKNLLPITATSTTINGTIFTVNDDKTITVSGTPSATANFVLSSLAITPQFSMIMSANAMPTGSEVVAKKTTNGTATYPALLYATTGTQKALEVGSKYEQIYLRISTTFTGTATFKLQIEAGSTATTYAPYFTPIELCKIGTYQDYIWNDNGTWKVHKATGKITFNGSASENWAYDTNRFRIDALADLRNIAGRQAVYSNNFTSLLSGTADYGIFAYYVSTIYQQIYVYDKDYTTTSDFKTWLSSHPTSVYYVLETPTDTAITESALITQLDNLVSAELLSGVNNIMLVPANQPNGSMSIDYTTWDKHDRYDVYIWNDAIGDYQLIHAGGGNN